MEYEIILASGSPRRRELMDRIGAKYTIIPSTKEEHMENIEPSVLVERLSKMKAEDVADGLDGNRVIIGADTVVAYGGRVLGKPHSRQEAFDMIRGFAGDTHHVYTGVCILVMENGSITKCRNFSVATAVTVTELSDEEILEYIATGEPMDKAGAYAIQGKFAPYIKEINGDYYNIVGFPICSICSAIKEEGIDIKTGKRYES